MNEPCRIVSFSCSFVPALACSQELLSGSLIFPTRSSRRGTSRSCRRPSSWINPLTCACLCCAPLCRTRVTKEAGSVSLRMKQVEEL